MIAGQRTALRESLHEERGASAANESPQRRAPVGERIGSMRDRRATASGAFGVAFGLAGAIATIQPSDWHSAEELQLPGILFAAGLLIYPSALFYYFRFRVLEYAEAWMFIGLIYWVLLDLLQGFYAVLATATAVRGAFIAMACFAWSILLGRSIFSLRLPLSVRRATLHTYSSQTYFRLAIVAFLLGMFPFAFFSGFDPDRMLKGLSAMKWSAPWSRGSKGNWHAIVEHLTYFGLLIPTLGACIVIQRRRVTISAIVVAFFSVVFLAFASQGGSRRYVGVALGAAMILWLLHHRRAMRVRHMVLVGGIIVIVLAWMELMLAYRNVGLGRFDFESHTFEKVSVDDNFRRICEIIDLIPEKHPHTTLEPIFYAVCRPIPRFLWAGKPVSAGFSLSDVAGLGDVALTSSIVGEAYVSGGFVMVCLWGAFFGALSGVCHQFFEPGRDLTAEMLFTFFVIALFSGLRSLVDLILMGYIFLAWIVIDYVYYKLFRAPGLS